MFFSYLKLMMCNCVGGVTTFQFPKDFFSINYSDLGLYFRLERYGTK